MHFPAAVMVLVSAMLAVSALPFDDTLPRDVTAANHISARSQPLAIITIKCILKSGADRTHDVKSWVQDLLKQRQVEHALKLSGHHVDIRIDDNPCHVDAHNTMDFALTQTNRGSCQANFCSGSFIADSPVRGELFNTHTNEIIFPEGSLSTTT